MDSYYVTRAIICHDPLRGIVGQISLLAGKPPAGYLECDGRKVGKMQYPELYEVIGDAYQLQIKNPGRRWYDFWEPKTIPEPLFYDFRLPNYRTATAPRNWRF